MKTEELELAEEICKFGKLKIKGLKQLNLILIQMSSKEEYENAIELLPVLLPTLGESLKTTFLAFKTEED